jgi:hypothetical protein
MGQGATALQGAAIHVLAIILQKGCTDLWFQISCTLSVMHSDTATACSAYSSPGQCGCFTRFPLSHALHASLI